MGIPSVHFMWPTLLVIATTFNSTIASGHSALNGTMMAKIIIAGHIKPTPILVILHVPIAVATILFLMLKIGEEYSSVKHTLIGSLKEDLL